MIKAEFAKVKWIKVNVWSTLNSKSATITDYKNCWQIQYDHNGARKNFSTYQACINYLVSKGW